MRLPRPIAATFAVVALASCGTGNTAEHLRPATPSAAQAMGEASCPVGGDRLLPLIVDWQQSQRGEIEATMRDSLAVVAYDCATIRVLPDCHIADSYSYVGVTLDEEVVQLRNADEVRANLPKSTPLALQIGSDLASGASIDVALVMVGLRRTARLHANRADLVGECEAAAA